MSAFCERKPFQHQTKARPAGLHKTHKKPDRFYITKQLQKKPLVLH